MEAGKASMPPESSDDADLTDVMWPAVSEIAKGHMPLLATIASPSRIAAENGRL